MHASAFVTQFQMTLVMGTKTVAIIFITGFFGDCQTRQGRHLGDDRPLSQPVPRTTTTVSIKGD